MPLLLFLIDLKAIDDVNAPVLKMSNFSVVTGALPPAFILQAVKLALQSGAEPIWHMPFVFVHSERSVVVGSGGFKGPPVDGRVEIGYGIAPTEQGKGIATEAVAALCKLAFDSPLVWQIFAETAVHNLPSQRVLEKNLFLRTGIRDTAEDGAVVQWQLTRVG
jgi:[ribosomal protein S5]-alanine N-acetyltransferase